ncbi:MAG: ATP-binding cassette domain-containing protein [Phaeodactylibacter sp.]|nr:ATP-binding cassette domain-containing protein [Phaeodactylibacter sp.]
MSSSILSLDNIVKTYDKNVAVDGVSFEVPKGSIFGLLGPNGAGKTSLIRIITTITRADTGTVLLDGEKLNSRHPEQIGYMPEERGLYRKMKVGEHLLYLARLKGLSKEQAKQQIQHWFEKFEIEDWWNKKVEELSKGMQQKIQFIATVVHEPKLLILDEPFSGLDPVNTNLIKDEIHQLHNQGVSIIFSTHRMEQVEEVCEHIVLINKGRNVLEGKVKDIKDQFKRNRFQIDYEGTLPAGLEQRADIVEQSGHSITIQVDEEGRSNELLQYLLQNGVFVIAFNEILPSLNEIFIRQVKSK